MKILIIAYYYPPLGTGGSLRPFRMKQYLEKSGNQVVVLTSTHDKTTLDSDEFRVKDCSYNMQRKGLRGLQWLIKRLLVEGKNHLGVYSTVFTKWKKDVLKLQKPLKNSFKPDIIIASYPPVECLELGLELSRLWNVPLISDFRDGLMFEPIEVTQMSRFKCIRTKYQKIEMEAVKKSIAIINTHKSLEKYFKNKYKAQKMLFLPNGCEKDDFEKLKQIALSKEHIHIIHAGNIGLSDPSRDIIPFFTALKNAINKNQNLVNRIRIHQFGNFNKGELNSATELIKKGVLIYHGYVDRKECLSFQRAADLLLIVASDQRPSMVPGKLYEYLLAGTPVMALGTPSAACQIVTESHIGFCMGASDLGSFVNWFNKVKKSDFKKYKKTPGSGVEKFYLENQMNELDLFLKNLPLN